MENIFYYEIGIMPNDDVNKLYSLYVKTASRLIGSDSDKIRYFVNNGLIPKLEARDAAYVHICTKEDYEQNIKNYFERI